MPLSASIHRADKRGLNAKNYSFGDAVPNVYLLSRGSIRWTIFSPSRSCSSSSLFSSSFYFPRFLVPESLNRDAPLTLSLEQRLSSTSQWPRNERSADSMVDRAEGRCSIRWRNWNSLSTSSLDQRTGCTPLLRHPTITRKQETFFISSQEGTLTGFRRTSGTTNDNGVSTEVLLQHLEHAC